MILPTLFDKLKLFFKDAKRSELAFRESDIGKTAYGIALGAGIFTLLGAIIGRVKKL